MKLVDIFNNVKKVTLSNNHKMSHFKKKKKRKRKKEKGLILITLKVKHIKLSLLTL